MRRGLLFALVAVGAVVFFGWLAAVLFTKPYRIPSASMEPALEVSDRVLVRRGGLDDPERGKIVVFNPPRQAETEGCRAPGFESPESERRACPRPAGGGESDQAFVSRVVAVGGDRVSIRRGRTYIDGKQADEDYLEGDAECAQCDLPREITIPPDHVFVMGDNRGESRDSREYGPIPDDAIVGPVMVRYWPPDRWGSP